MLLQRLATGEWFTSRVSSCGAFISAYPQAPKSLQSDLRALFAHLCRDDTPMVRRAAAQNLASFARIVEPDLVPSEFLPLFQYLTQDGERAGRHGSDCQQCHMSLCLVVLCWCSTCLQHH
jgi:serine/threonine-protein phosphatase 2A regulatory subunit A